MKKLNLVNGKSYVCVSDKRYSNSLMRSFFLLDTNDDHFLVYLVRNELKYKFRKVYHIGDNLHVLFISIKAKNDNKFRELMERAYQSFLLSNGMKAVETYNNILSEIAGE